MVSADASASTSKTPQVKVGCAPVSFGVDEVQPDAWRPSPDDVLDLIAELGFSGTELGPPGYLGDPRQVRRRLGARSLALVGAYQPLRFSDREGFGEDLAELVATLRLWTEASPTAALPKAVLAESFTESARMALAGRVAGHPEVRLSNERFEIMVANIHRAGERCQAAGIDAVFHPHAGTFVETNNEIRRLADRLDPTLVGLCLDTGHARFGGAEPSELVRDYGPLIRHVHLKDCDAEVLGQVVADEGSLRDALKAGAFCEFGGGDAGIARVLQELARIEYSGWLVIEQDRFLAAPTDRSDLAEPQMRNLDYVRRWWPGTIA
jgi:inosose dehydratase